jgi:transketolase
MGKLYENLVVIEADISKSTYSCLFREAYPHRYFNVGIAEQNLMGVAAGLAAMDFIPVVTTYAVFASMRACEQIRTSICYPNLNVKIFVSHGGITPGSDGATHQAVEDLSLLRALPNMTVIMPADEIQTHQAVGAALAFRGPVYLRLTRCPVEPVFEGGAPFVLGQAVMLRDGRDVALVAIGDMLSEALAAADQLAAQGVAASVINMHTLKPLDEAALLHAAKTAGAIVTVEDNSILGGLGGAVCECLAGRRPVPVVRVGLNDCFAESGEYPLLLEKYGMSRKHIVKAALRAVDMKKGST